MNTIKKVSIDEIYPNKDNPRSIEPNKLNKLKDSIKNFPEMMELRPIVVDDTNTILGGNMRYTACKELGLKEIYIIHADELTEEQKKEFILKDNNAYGEWDWDKLQSWDKDILTNAGFDDWELVGIYGLEKREEEFKGNLEGSNFNEEEVDVNNYIKQNIIFFNEMMIEFEDDEIKKSIRNIMEGSVKEHFEDDLKQLIRQYGKNSV